ncbi:MAG: hypothetical protein COV47_03605 [Candidatus Diapherotrites archaeon CG11_big_fil_rev_8_21_14_0_20_37_9]|nr:MAG: hypothetical protein COV47_03605 [Candidatus Diapherotrites archaeon CG11_big_fil_rev_8_21_14_0_20_37_9]
MKGFNVKKLVAIAAGAALLGTAIAPIVSATSVTKDDIYNSNGSPRVNIVIGSEAALSDAVWAGNLAAKIAEKAATTKSVSATPTGASGDGTADVDLSDLTVDVTVGGTVTFGAGTKRYQVSMGSSTTIVEVNAGLDGSHDANALSDSQLPHLYNASITQKVNNGDQSNARNSLTVQEKIGVNFDALFDKGSDTKDLVGKIAGAGDFAYIVTVGSSTNGIDLGSTSFTDGSDDDVKLVFFGEEYELSSATFTAGSTKYVKLVKSSAKERYSEGEVIEGLVGDGLYAGEEVTVKVVQIVQTGAATDYTVTFELYDAEGNLIDTQTVNDGQNMKDVFNDADQDDALASNLFVDTVAVGSTTGVGYVEVTKGTDTVELYDQAIYPYDASHTGSKPYIATITTGTGDVNSLYSIKISNSAELWSDPDNGSFDLGPLYASRAGQSITGGEKTTASFLESLPEGTQGKDYAKVEFLGFEGDEEKTTVEIGKSVQSKGAIKYRDDDDAEKIVPFYQKVGDTNTGTNFEFDGQDFWASMRYATSGSAATQKTGAYDYNLLVATGDYVNGRLWTISSTSNGLANDANGTILVGGVGQIFGGLADINVMDKDTFTIDGVTYTVEDANITTAAGANANSMIVSVDAVVDIREGVDSSASTWVFNTAGDTTDASYGLLALTNNVTFDGNAGTVGFYSDGDSSTTNSRDVFYAARYNDGSAVTSNLWFLLDADVISTTIQNSHAVTFLGSRVPNDDGTYTETAGIRGIYAGGTVANEIAKDGTTWVYGHYVPKDTDFNNSTMFNASEAYIVAEFQVNSAADTAQTEDFNVYIDTIDGGTIGSFPSTNLSAYASDASYLGAPTWNLTAGTQSNYLQAGYSDNGSKIWLVDTDAGVKVSMPQTAEKVDIIVYGKEVERSVSGGETLTLGVGETGTTDSGTEITVEAANGGSCSIAGADGAVACTANPTSYKSPAAVKNPLVYLDVDNPTGPNILIGGHLVNSLASSLADRLTAPGVEPIAEVGASGDVYVAGYTAQETVSAVKELIQDIESWDLA